MKRVIKFRAWDDRNKVMFHFFRMCKPKGSGTLSFECKDNLHEEWDNVDWDSIHVMQFTGLLDKNGKEIYEGDVVKCHDHPTGVDDLTSKVEFMHGHYQVDGHALHDYGTAWTEIVGNVFENPDLLK